MSRVLFAVLLLVAGCSSPDADPADAAASESAPETATDTAEVARPRSPSFDQALHDELMAMFERDQSGRTQIGCGADGPVPATPIADEAAVDDLRATAGLSPLADYLAEMNAVCAAD